MANTAESREREIDKEREKERKEKETKMYLYSQNKIIHSFSQTFNSITFIIKYSYLTKIIELYV